MAIEFRNGNSFLHRLDARTKIMMFAIATVVSVVIIDPVIMGILFLLLYWMGTKAVDSKYLNKNLRVLVVIFLTFSMFQILFFTPSDSHFLFYLIPGKQWISVTVEGIIRGMAVFFRFFSVVLSVHLMLYSTPPVDLVLALTRRIKTREFLKEVAGNILIGLLFTVIAFLTWPDEIQSISLSPWLRVLAVALISLVSAFVLQRILSKGLPPEMGVALTLGFATVGILSQQTQKITDAQKARGYDVQPKNIVQRVRVLTALLIPIFLATLERSQNISIAILARGFDYNIDARTYRRQLIFTPEDYLFFLIMVALLITGMVLNYFGVGNITEQLILTWIGN
ncbi:MAG: energy-coupling factor transporter transmembrane protein EcfT [Deltaproteobacteria bacterium]|nr:energy-coupling factor transporter transmembrane protein EcfT [Deltaproteobacteria bacterium]